MFGCIVAGRPLQPAQQLSENKFLFSIADAANVNHICVFLLGTAPIPPGFGEGVYFGWPPYKEFKFLGFLSNEKPSAIFRVGGTNPNASGNQNPIDIEMTSADSSVILQIGISIEPMEIIQQQLSQKEVTMSSASSSSNIPTPEMLKFAQKTLQNLFNYAMSFGKPVPTGAFGQTQEMIPTEVFKRWYTTFETKIQKDSDFWKDKAS